MCGVELNLQSGLCEFETVSAATPPVGPGRERDVWGGLGLVTCPTLFSHRQC